MEQRRHGSSTTPSASTEVKGGWRYFKFHRRCAAVSLRKRCVNRSSRSFFDASVRVKCLDQIGGKCLRGGANRLADAFIRAEHTQRFRQQSRIVSALLRNVDRKIGHGARVLASHISAEPDRKFGCVLRMRSWRQHHQGERGRTHERDALQKRAPSLS